jgi:hypothetical protein
VCFGGRGAEKRKKKKKRDKLKRISKSKTALIKNRNSD